MKNKVDGVRSTPCVPLCDVMAFIAVMNEATRPYLAASGHSTEDANKVHLAWRKSPQLQTALWTRFYRDTAHAPSEWQPERSEQGWNEIRETSRGPH